MAHLIRFGSDRLVCGRVAIVLFGLLLSAAPAVAQQSGIVTGIVRDPQGGVLPGVTVTVSSESLIGGNRSTVTGEAGSYQFALPPGT